MSRCPNCSEEVPASARFCLHCGERMAPPAVDGEIVAIRSTVIKAGRVTLGAEVDSGECPICGRHNARTATFRCKGCNRPLICTTHQDPQSLLCSDCMRERLRKSKFVTVAPDGSGDFTTLDEAVAQCASGETINLVAGEHQLDSPLIISKPLTLVGAGMDQTSLVCDAEDFIVRFVGSGRFAARGIAFRHEGISLANGVEAVGGTLKLVQCRFTGCVCDEDHQMLGSGLLLGGQTRGLVSSCIMDNNTVGVTVKDASRPTLEANRCQANGQGIRFEDNASGVARRNECIENESCGIIVIESSPTLEANVCRKNCEGIFLLAGAATVRGNECIENETSGIEVSDGYPTLEGNTCRANKDGIHFSSDGGGLVSGNNCSENRSTGIRVSYGNAVLRLESNTCCKNEGNGIDYTSTADGVIRGNDCSGNKGNGIKVWQGKPTIRENTCLNNNGFGIAASDLAESALLSNRCVGNRAGDKLIW